MDRWLDSRLNGSSLWCEVSNSPGWSSVLRLLSSSSTEALVLFSLLLKWGYCVLLLCSQRHTVTLLIPLMIDNRAVCVFVCVFVPLLLSLVAGLRPEPEGARRLGGRPRHGRRVPEGPEEPVCGGRSSHAVPGGSQQGTNTPAWKQLSLRVCLQRLGHIPTWRWFWLKQPTYTQPGHIVLTPYINEATVPPFIAEIISCYQNIGRM